MRLSREKAGNQRKRKEKLTKAIESLHPIDDWETLASHNKELNNILAIEEEEIMHKARVQYVEEGGKCIAFFFRQAKQLSKASNITKLRINWRITEDKIEIEKYIHSEYKELYEE